MLRNEVFVVWVEIWGTCPRSSLRHCNSRESILQLQQYSSDVELCEGLLEIGEFAEFACMSCSSLKRIKIPSTVTWICVNAFYGCGKLDTIQLIMNKQESYQSLYPNTIDAIGLQLWRDILQMTLILGLAAFQSKLAENEAEYHKLKVELALWKNKMNGISHREIKNE